MKNEHYTFTSESVSPGHPDKIADQISDSILDSLLAHDSAARVACETMVTSGLVVIGGEITTHTPEAAEALSQSEKTARDTIRRIGYTGDIGMHFDADNCGVLRVYHSQSENIARGVDREGAGDQGLMFGFATRETHNLMPLAIDISHRLLEQHEKVLKQGENGPIPGLRPDAKSQVTIEYDINNKPVKVDTIVLSTQHTPKWSGAAEQASLKQHVLKHIIEPVLANYDADLYNVDSLILHVNPTGEFEIGGPHGDVGLTGRKIIVDTYGGRGRHGGGAFSGKDPTKVDRSAAYMARYIAKNLVASEVCQVCEVQLSYAIGLAEPTSIHIDTYRTGTIAEPDIVKLVRELFPLTPRGIIEHLNLRNPIYSPTAAYGHFGRQPDSICVNGETYETFTWEKTDMANAIKNIAKKY